MARKVLVFGATGEIGGRIARLAVDAGHRVYGASRGGNTLETVDLTGVEMCFGDKNDPEFLAALAAKIRPDAVIDSVPSHACVDLYMKYFPMAENVFFCSSTGTFVPLRYFPADENHPWREETAVNFHYQSIRDGYALDQYRDKGFPITIFRPTNIIGPGRVPLELWGGRDIEFFRLLRDSRPVTIAPCEEILVQSGYNLDLARSFVLGLDHPEQVRGQIYIISCKRAVTLGRYLETAMEFLGSRSEIRHARPEELCRLYPDITMHFGLEFLFCHMCLDIGKAERELGYAPEKSTEAGLVESLAWCRERALL